MELSSLAGVMVTDDNSVLPDTPRVGTGCGVAQLLGKGVGNSCGSYHFVKTPRCFRMLKKGRWVLVVSRQWLRSARTLRWAPYQPQGAAGHRRKGSSVEKVCLSLSESGRRVCNTRAVDGQRYAI